MTENDDLNYQALELVRRFGGYRAASRASGIPKSTLQDRVKAVNIGKVANDVQSSSDAVEMPLSEDVAKFKPNWTAEDCIVELRRVAELDPEKSLSRNYFRIHSRISEATWSRYYGTFEEFMRQSGIKLTRHQRRMEHNVVRHASVDNFREMNSEKRGWEDRYLKPHGGRFQDVIIATDIHDRECDPFWRICFIDTLRRVQPEKIVFGGDLFDLPEFGKYTVDPRQWDVVGRIRWVHAFLQEVREACPDAEIILIEGNHEHRLLRHLSEATPGMRAVLSDLHGFTVPKLLGLDTFEVNYVARMDLGTFSETDVKKEMAKNYHVLFDSLMVHHFPEGRNMGFPGVNGHHHKHITWPFYSPIFGSTEWSQIGCGHKRAAEYCAGEKWAMGFMLAHVDTYTKQTQFEYIEIRDHHSVIGGRWYFRDQLIAA